MGPSILEEDRLACRFLIYLVRLWAVIPLLVVPTWATIPESSWSTSTQHCRYVSAQHCRTWQRKTYLSLRDPDADRHQRLPMQLHAAHALSH